MAPLLESPLKDHYASRSNNQEQDSRTWNNPIRPSPYLSPSDLNSEFDLVCVGFGPASLAIAVALHDALAAGRKLQLAHGNDGPKVLFIEKQSRFAWHAGMLLPGVKMQISFIKDLATLRDPRSEFTFLNYLHRNERLVDFTNLGTFLPARAEYEDYLCWSASHFHHLVQYGQEVVSVSPEMTAGGEPVQTFAVQSRDILTGQKHSYHARNVLLATGGRPSFPKSFPDPVRHPNIIHSSQYAHMVPRILPKKESPYSVAVLGAGQSAAEIFYNIQKLYPNCKTVLIMRQGFLRPSDDSPFVNSVFNPEYINTLFPKSAPHRNNFLTEARATNYGVVRLELIEELYETMYHQRRELGPDERAWPHRILGGRQLTSITTGKGNALNLEIENVENGERDTTEFFQGDKTCERVTLEVDLLIAATGYQRNAHVELLKNAWDMLPEAPPSRQDFSRGVTGWNVQTEQGERKMAVGRDYQVQFAPGTVARGSGVWLQGCCEGTHGLSDTLLSVLATRSGEIVNSIFGDGN